MKTKAIILTLIISATTVLNGQITTADATNFSNSYVQEQYKNYTKAIEALMQSYKENSYEYNFRLGWLNYLNQDYTKSQSYYKKAIALKPKSIEARMGLVYPLAALNNISALEKLYMEVVKINPGHTLANYRLAYIKYTSKKYSEAEKYLQSVLDLFPFDYDSMVLMAEVKISLGKLDEAKKLYNSALLYNPSDASVKAALKKLG